MSKTRREISDTARQSVGTTWPAMWMLWAWIEMLQTDGKEWGNK